MNDAIQLGTREIWEQDAPVALRHEDARHHAYIIGKTGSGKTTLLRYMILQHLYLGHRLHYQCLEWPRKNLPYLRGEVW